MMSSIVLSRRRLIALIALWWVIFFALFLNTAIPQLESFQNIVGLPFILLLPGYLILRIIELRASSFWTFTGLAVGFSVLSLMFLGLIMNLILPFFGNWTPLSPESMFNGVSVLIAALCLLFYLRGEDIVLPAHSYLFFPSIRDSLFAFTPAVFVALSALGAMRINNGGNNSITLFMLLGIGIFAGVFIFQSHKKGHFHPSVPPTALYFIALAVLFMTSLRGWHTVGHDIQIEYYVFQLVRESGIWSMEAFRNAYNACISITILPTTFAALLSLPDPYVYKVIYQMIFALVPPLVYHIARRYVSMSLALLSAFFFLSFPTFFGDMPFLNRQEIAFLFWALMIWVIFDTDNVLRLRRIVFVLFGIGVVLSHYSTTYTVIALLLFLIVSRPIVLYFLKQARIVTLFQRSGMFSINGLENPARNMTITKGMITLLCVATFLWSSVLTDTSSGSLTRVVTKTFVAMRDATKEDARSADVFYSLFSWNKQDPKQVLADYRRNVEDTERKKFPEGTFYPTEEYASLPMDVYDESKTPLSGIGNYLASLGLPVHDVHYLQRQFFAKILQVFLLVGLLYSVFRTRFLSRPLGPEVALFMFGSLAFIASQVLLPVLSSEYGIFRAFQQSLIFLGINIAIGASVTFGLLHRGRHIILPVTFAVLFFLSMTGVFTRIVMLEPSQLHLGNHGLYYDLYYTNDSDIMAAAWVNEHIPKGVGAILQTDKADASYIKALTGVDVINGIYPGLVRRNAYVMLHKTNTKKGVSLILWNSDAVQYTYPEEFLVQHKDLVYDNGEVRIYK